jgi:hypothetical protein
MTAFLSVQWSMIPAVFDANRLRPADKPVGYLNPEILCVTPSPTQVADIYDNLPVEDLAKQSARAAVDSIDFERLDRPLVH